MITHSKITGMFKQAGFTLITALFLLVVVALLSVYMINLRNVQQSTVVFGLQGARAMQAAQAGLEWGIYQAMQPVPSCLTTNPTFSATGAALSAFTIELNCVETSHLKAQLKSSCINSNLPRKPVPMDLLIMYLEVCGPLFRINHHKSLYIK